MIFSCMDIGHLDFDYMNTLLNFSAWISVVCLVCLILIHPVNFVLVGSEVSLCPSLASGLIEPSVLDVYRKASCDPGKNDPSRRHCCCGV